VKVFTIRPHGERDLRQYGALEATVIAQSKFDSADVHPPNGLAHERPSVLRVFGTATQAPQQGDLAEREVVGLHARCKAQVELTGR
jgi:hypothetical protein